MTIAVLLATYNRREKTLSCLQKLKRQVLPKDVRLEIFITDDASSDGTPEAVQAEFPDVTVFAGSGSLFWAGGMRHTWTRARESTPDFYLLLNDDTLLYPHAVSTLLETSGLQDNEAIVIGSTRDERSGSWSYGGWQLTSKWFWKSARVVPSTAASCDFANANIMLVPSGAVEKIGILASDFTHSLADYDYTLKARKAGIPVKVASGYLGVCEDDHGNNWKAQNTTLKERIKYLKSPKGLAYSEYLLFIRRHFPMSYPTAFVKLWMKTFFPFIWERFKKQKLSN